MGACRWSRNDAIRPMETVMATRRTVSNARRRERLVLVGGALLFLSTLVFGVWSAREPERPEVLHQVTLAVSGLH